MAEYRRTLCWPFDADALAGAIYSALAERPTPPRFPYESAFEPGPRELWSGPDATGLHLCETWAWQMTRDDEQLACSDRTWDAVCPGARFSLAAWSTTARLTITGEPAVLARGLEALHRTLGQSADELDVMDVLATSAAFAIDVFSRPHTRLASVRYSPMRLGWVRSGDDRATLAALDRLAAAAPDLDAAPLVAALLLALAGRLDDALARLDDALARPRAAADLALCKADVLSRLGRADDARVALPVVSPDDPLAHGAAALAVAVHRRAGQPALAAVAAGGFGREAQWFLADHVDPRWMREAAARHAPAGYTGSR